MSSHITNCVNFHQLVAIDLIFTWVENSYTASQQENLIFYNSSTFMLFSLASGHQGLVRCKLEGLLHMNYYCPPDTKI